jgi:hypothetical protein
MDKSLNLQGKTGTRSTFPPNFRPNLDQKRPDIGLKMGDNSPKKPTQFTILTSIGSVKTVVDDEISRGNRYVGAVNQIGGEVVLVFDKINGI